jgi:hypothetical protein
MSTQTGQKVPSVAACCCCLAERAEDALLAEAILPERTVGFGGHRSLSDYQSMAALEWRVADCAAER